MMEAVKRYVPKSVVRGLLAAREQKIRMSKAAVVDVKHGDHTDRWPRREIIIAGNACNNMVCAFPVIRGKLKQ